MKVLVDTPVWSYAFRRQKPVDGPEVRKLRTLLEQEEEIFLMGIILMEILQGVKDRLLVQRLKRSLSIFPLLEPSRDDYTYAAEIRNTCVSKGVQASTIDFLIAAMAIRSNALLLTSDKDFLHMTPMIPLKIC